MKHVGKKINWCRKGHKCSDTASFDEKYLAYCCTLSPQLRFTLRVSRKKVSLACQLIDLNPVHHRGGES